MPNDWPYFVEGSSFASFMDLPQHGVMVLEVQKWGMSLLALQLIYIVSLGWSNHCGVSEPPTPQPEDFQMRGTPQSSVPQLSIPQVSVPQLSIPQLSVPQSFVPQLSVPQLSIPQLSVPKSALPQSSLLQSSFSPSSFPQSPFPQSSFPQSSFPQASFPAITSLPLAQPSPHPSVSSTMLLNRIVSLEIELQEVMEVLEAMTQSRDEACLALGNILAALNTIVENTQLGGT
ncbi:hypothetical protein BS47DRAFT_1368394 [Hydnum rufescens UP504]|uniref:Uncharacterized protein n=1 Tax=Hydnum rufescens UP504 TaxID=1448309 RepID=A0A9P6AGP4_9AGAM|nr:hypothetical protein BS47DRAFT_1368394 [Hydnum rufescens UP504]